MQSNGTFPRIVFVFQSWSNDGGWAVVCKEHRCHWTTKLFLLLLLLILFSSTCHMNKIELSFKEKKQFLLLLLLFFPFTDAVFRSWWWLVTPQTKKKWIDILSSLRTYTATGNYLSTMCKPKHLDSDNYVLFSYSLAK